MNLEVGMYVRTIKGIDKVLLVEYAEEKRQKYPNHPSKKYWRDKIYLSKERYWRTSQNIIKASHNIIDLIEEGDYVNGDLVLFAGATTWDNDENVLYKQVHINHNGYDWWLSKEQIKSIVTKEQFESIKYSLEG